jgi:hypothetical protein
MNYATLAVHFFIKCVRTCSYSWEFDKDKYIRKNLVAHFAHAGKETYIMWHNYVYICTDPHMTQHCIIAKLLSWIEDRWNSLTMKVETIQSSEQSVNVFITTLPKFQETVLFIVTDMRTSDPTKKSFPRLLLLRITKRCVYSFLLCPKTFT